MSDIRTIVIIGASLAGAEIGDNPDGRVDVSAKGDASETMAVSEWLAQASAAA